MLKSVIRQSNLWFTGAATFVVVASAAYYVAFGEPESLTTDETKRKSKARNKISGLVNEGNTCYINTTIQALASCPIFMWWINSLIERQVDLSSLRTSTSLHMTLAVINNQHPTIDAHPFNTRQLIQSLEKHGWNIKSEEQDAHEFFNTLFTTIDEEINPKIKSLKGIGLSFGQAMVNPFQPTLSIPFRGYLASQLCCLTCGHKASVRYDAFECLSIPLPKLDVRNAFTMLTVEGLLKQFLAAETVGEVQCDNCSVRNGKGVFAKQLSLGKLPQCLCLHIARTNWTATGQLTKRQDLVKFSEELNVGSFVYTNRLTGNFKPVIYRLRAVVEHLGMADSGHFVTFRRHLVNGTDRIKWFYTSDTYIRKSNIEEVLKSSPYMLFYERCT